MTLALDIQVLNLATAVTNQATTIVNEVAGINAAVALASSNQTLTGTQSSTATALSTAASTNATAVTTISGLTGTAYAGTTALNETIAGVNKMFFSSTGIVASIIYDTKKDSDGGAWRKRCQHTSWYKEQVYGRYLGEQATEAAARAVANATTRDFFHNTTDGLFYSLLAGSGVVQVYRGNKREFPEVVAITAEAGRVIIWDLTDSSVPMWMVFVGGSNNLLMLSGYNNLTAINGQIWVGSNSYGLAMANIIKDTGYLIWNSTANTERFVVGLAYRNSNIASNWVVNTDYKPIINPYINSLAATILPTSPIDPATGLPVPTIAVGTTGGVSVIKDDGTVVNKTFGASISGIVFFDKSGNLIAKFGNAAWAMFPDLTATTTLPSTNHNDLGWSGAYDLPLLCGTGTGVRSSNYFDVASQNYGITRIAGTGHQKTQNTMLAAITNTYNSGWMNGDIRLAALADTVVETMGVTNSGVNLITGDSANFNGGTVGNWVTSTSYSATAAIVGSALQITPTVAYGRWVLPVTLVVGQNYLFTGSVKLVSGTQKVMLGVSPFSSGASVSIIGFIETTATAGSIANASIQFTATATTVWVTAGDNMSTVGSVCEIDNISIVPINELLPNGTNPTVTTGWNPTNCTIAVVNGELELTATAIGVCYANATFPRVNSKMYALKASGYVKQTGGIAYLGCDNGVYIGSTTSQTIVPMGSGQYVGSAIGGVNIRIDATAIGQKAAFNFVSMTEATPDRSVKANPLTVVGTLTKSAVNTGSQLVAYSGFSASNYLTQPYSANLDFGTGDFCIMGWVSFGASNTDRTILSRGDGVSAGSFWIRQYLDNKLYAYIHNGTTFIGLGSTPPAAYTDGLFHFIAITRTSSAINFYIDGKNTNSGLTSSLTMTNTTASLRIGENQATSNPLTSGFVSLLRASATAPSADQISYIYETERKLFEPGAQCTIQGTSTAVTTLTYDNETDLLDVGTSWGRTTFKGLAVQSSEAATNGSAVSYSRTGNTLVQAGATGAKIVIPSKTIRAELSRTGELKKEINPDLVQVDFDAIAAQTAFTLPYGMSAQIVYSAGIEKRLGSAKDYTISNDGFRDTVNFNVAPGAAVWVSVMCTRNV